MLFRLFFSLFMIFLLLVIGSYILSQFPQLQPLWDLMKSDAVNLYHESVKRFGETGTILIIVAIVILIGGSASSRHFR